MEQTFQEFVAELDRETGTAQAVADAIEISLSAFSRGVRNQGTLSVENLLRLAEWSGRNPSWVLEIANKADVARLIERLFGKPRAPLAAIDEHLLALPLPVKQQVVRLAQTLAPATDVRRKRA